MIYGAGQKREPFVVATARFCQSPRESTPELLVSRVFWVCGSKFPKPARAEVGRKVCWHVLVSEMAGEMGGDFGEWLDCCYWTGRKGSFVGEMIEWCKAEGAVLILAV